MGPASAKNPTFETDATTASRTSPLAGLKTRQPYRSEKVAEPVPPSRIAPWPTDSMPVTQMMKPYLPEQVPSTCGSFFFEERRRSRG